MFSTLFSDRYLGGARTDDDLLEALTLIRDNCERRADKCTGRRRRSLLRLALTIEALVGEAFPIRDGDVPEIGPPQNEEDAADVQSE
jgi:hypothetical protein